jgi:hypothetical protein
VRLVILESPFAGDKQANIDYARLCVRDSLMRGEAPIASHLLYTQPTILDDSAPEERRMGIAAGLAWVDVADVTVVYTDLGISTGMKHGISDAKTDGRPVEYRTIKNQSIKVEQKSKCPKCGLSGLVAAAYCFWKNP